MEVNVLGDNENESFEIPSVASQPYRDYTDNFAMTVSPLASNARQRREGAYRYDLQDGGQQARAPNGHREKSQRTKNNMKIGGIAVIPAHPSEFEVLAEESEIDSWAQSQETIGSLETTRRILRFYMEENDRRCFFCGQALEEGATCHCLFYL
jgi:hypothetical protein